MKGDHVRDQMSAEISKEYCVRDKNWIIFVHAHPENQAKGMILLDNRS